MFLCKECHKDANCDFCDFDIGLGISFGNCEGCGKGRPCVDCHFYNFTKPRTPNMDGGGSTDGSPRRG